MTNSDGPKNSLQEDRRDMAHKVQTMFPNETLDQ